MNIKQHNDIVQKLLSQIQHKDKQLTKLNKQLTALSKSSYQLQNNKGSKPTPPADIQKQVQKRISQLNKQHIAKLTQLNQQIKSLTQQNNDLKQRLALKNNLDQKEKEHIAQVIKKNIDRKPGSQHDIKITALVSHYQNQLGKKNNYIQTLKRQLKAGNVGEGKNIIVEKQGRKIESETRTRASLGNLIQQSQNSSDENEQSSTENARKSVPLLQHKQIIEKLETKIQNFQVKEEKKNKQLIDLRSRYNQLTKQYYRVLNEYGIQTAKISKNTTNYNNSNKFSKQSPFRKEPAQLSQSAKTSKQSRISFALSDQEDQSPQQVGNDTNEVSISLDFEEKFKKFSNRPKLNPDSEDVFPQILSNQSLTKASSFQENKKVFAKKTSVQVKIIKQIISVLNLTNEEEIIPTLTEIVSQQSFAEVTEQIIRYLHEILYKFGMGKVARSQMLQSLKIFDTKCTLWLQANQLINQICIQLGAKKKKLIQKITYYKQSETQHLQKMKSINFLTQLNKSHKLIQFINFFELDKSDLQLPEQLKNIYQQLKYVDKFVKQAHMTMELQERKGLEEVLEIVLRKIQKYHEWEVELQKQNQRKSVNIRTSQKLAYTTNDKS